MRCFNEFTASLIIASLIIFVSPSTYSDVEDYELLAGAYNSAVGDRDPEQVLKIADWLEVHTICHIIIYSEPYYK